MEEETELYVLGSVCVKCSGCKPEWYAIVRNNRKHVDIATWTSLKNQVLSEEKVRNRIPLCK